MRMISGKPVVDADAPVTLQITQGDCERGSKKDPTKCAAALALKRVTGCDEARVHVACTYLRFANKWLRYATPPSLKAEIISFDRGGGFYPGDFRLHPMPAANRLRPVKHSSGAKRTPSMTFVSKGRTEHPSQLELDDSSNKKPHKIASQRTRTEKRSKQNREYSIA
jgi:hypothetical protein